MKFNSENNILAELHNIHKINSKIIKARKVYKDKQDSKIYHTLHLLCNKIQEINNSYKSIKSSPININLKKAINHQSKEPIKKLVILNYKIKKLIVNFNLKRF